MNSCELVRAYFLECDWPEGGPQRAADMMAHLQTCPGCAAAAAEFSRMTAALQNDNPGAPSGGWSAFEQRLIDKAVHRRQATPWPWMAMAASVLIAVSAYSLGRWTTGPAASTVPLAGMQGSETGHAMIGAMSQTDIDRHVKAFDEISGVFEHRAAWLLVGDNTSDMGVSNRAIEHEHQVLLLRLTMLRSKKLISTADLVILPGQAASLTVPADDNASLRYRIRTSDDQPTRLMISTQLLTPKGSEVLGALETTLQVEPGQKLSAGNMVTTAGDYELQIAFGRSDMKQNDQHPNP
jgi:hypothetical protein